MDGLSNTQESQFQGHLNPFPWPCSLLCYRVALTDCNTLLFPFILPPVCPIQNLIKSSIPVRLLFLPIYSWSHFHIWPKSLNWSHDLLSHQCFQSPSIFFLFLSWYFFQITFLEQCYILPGISALNPLHPCLSPLSSNSQFWISPIICLAYKPFSWDARNNDKATILSWFPNSVWWLTPRLMPLFLIYCLFQTVSIPFKSLFYSLLLHKLHQIFSYFTKNIEAR